MGSSADAGRAAAAAASSFGVGIGGDTAGDIPGDGGPSSCSSRRRRPSPPQPLPPPPPPPGVALSAPRPAPAGIPSDGNSAASSMSIPGSLLPVLGAEDPHPLARWPPGPRAPSNPGAGGVGCGGGLDADAGGACRALAAAADAAAASACRLRRSKAQRRLALAPHRLEQRVRELTARVEPRGGDRPRWGAAAAARVNTAAVGEPRDDLVDRGIVRLRRSREWGAVVRVMVGRRTRERRSFVARGGSTHLGRAAELGRRALGWIERVAYLQYRVHGARSGSTPASEADPVARAERSGPAPDEVISNVERSVVFNKGY